MLCEPTEPRSSMNTGATGRAGWSARARPSCCSPRTRRTSERLFGAPNRTPYVKDGINDYVVHGAAGAVNPRTHGHEGRGALPR